MKNLMTHPKRPRGNGHTCRRGRGKSLADSRVVATDSQVKPGEKRSLEPIALSFAS